MLLLPVKSSTVWSRIRFQEGTPAILVTFSPTVLLVICSNFSSKSEIKAISAAGVLINWAQNGRFSISTAERSP